jgi:hypothetical protein
MNDFLPVALAFLRALNAVATAALIDTHTMRAKNEKCAIQACFFERETGRLF